MIERRTLAVVAGLWMAAAPCRSARADRVDIEIPVLIDTAGPRDEPRESEQVDPSLLVKSAAKRLESVLETSSIVTVVTREEILARGYRQIADVLGDVPGFESWGNVWYSGRRIPLARGQGRTILVLWNGVPMNDPSINLAATELEIPLDSVERLEIVSGPGGVLWGANAFLGIVNVVTRRADDLSYRAEATATAGGGPGRQAAMGVNATVADTLLDGDLGVYLNVGVTSSRDAALGIPYDVLFTPFPGSADGTVTLNESSGALDTDRDVCVPLTVSLDYGDLRFDMLGNFYCRFLEEIDPRGIRTDHFVDSMGTVYDGGHTVRASELTVAALQWRGAIADDVRLAARAYYSGFRFIKTEQMFHPPGQLGDQSIVAETRYVGANPLLNDGAYRTGTAVDASALWSRHSLLGGIEAYLEGQRDWDTESAGTPTLTIVEESTIVPAAQRIVLAGFASDKLRLPRGLTGELAARVQAAVGDEAARYDPQYLVSGSLVWPIARHRYLKLNYAEGFRPPQMDSINPEEGSVASIIGGNVNLVPERSRAFEAELSALVLRNHRTVRHIHLRGGYQLSDLDDLVLGRSGTLRNAGRRIIHTAEARADVRFDRGHRLVVAGHLLLAEDSEIGPVRNAANLKLHAAWDWAASARVRGIAALTVLGAREDLNRMPIATDVVDVDFLAPSGSVVVDRTPPLGLLRLGVRVVDLWERFDAGAYVENAFDARPAVPDVDFEKREAFMPQTIAGMSAYLTITGRL